MLALARRPLRGRGCCVPFPALAFAITGAAEAQVFVEGGRAVGVGVLELVFRVYVGCCCEVQVAGVFCKVLRA